MRSCILSALIFYASALHYAQKLPSLSVIFTAGTDGHACYRVPGAVSAPSGALLVFVEARGASCEDNTPKDVMLARSNDGGVTWDAPVVVMPGFSLGTNHTYRNPTPVFSADGTLILQFVNTTVQPWRSLQLTSADEGRTWSSPADPRLGVADSLLAGPASGILLRTPSSPRPGRLLFCGTNYYDPGNQPPVGARTWLSDDGGRTWTAPPGALFPTMAECVLAELADGSLLINFRANHENATCMCRAQARSINGGTNWSPLEYAPALIEPVCSAGLLQTSAGLYFSNPASRTSRINMTVRWSSDGGMTWPQAQQIWPAGSAYSVLVPIAASGVGVIFERISAAGNYSDVVFAVVKIP